MFVAIVGREERSTLRLTPVFGTKKIVPAHISLTRFE
jgi:hypothetical protein